MKDLTMKRNGIITGILLMSLLVSTTGCAQKKSDGSDKKDSTIEVKGKNTSSYIPSNQLVCKLIGAELAEKKELLKTEILSLVKEVDEVDNGYILKFEDKDDMLLKLMDYLMIEKECCPFFVFDLNIQPNSNGISLKISGQEGAKDMLKPLIDEINIKK